MLGAAKCQRHRSSTRGDQHMPSLNGLSADRDRVSPGEASFAVKRIDAAFRVSPLMIGRYGIGESAFEGNQLPPVDPEIAGHAAAAHVPGHVDRFGTADQHLLRIAAAQGAGSAERKVIDDRNRPSGRTHTEARHLRGCAAANDNEIVGFAFAHLTFPCLVLAL